jgi:hypothetical protein
MVKLHDQLPRFKKTTPTQNTSTHKNKIDRFCFAPSRITCQSTIIQFFRLSIISHSNATPSFFLYNTSIAIHHHSHLVIVLCTQRWTDRPSYTRYRARHQVATLPRAWVWRRTYACARAWGMARSTLLEWSVACTWKSDRGWTRHVQRPGQKHCWERKTKNAFDGLAPAAWHGYTGHTRATLQHKSVVTCIYASSSGISAGRDGARHQQ